MSEFSTWKLKDREAAHIAFALSRLTSTALREQGGSVFGHEPMTDSEIQSLKDRFCAMFTNERGAERFLDQKQ